MSTFSSSQLLAAAYQELLPIFTFLPKMLLSVGNGSRRYDSRGMRGVDKGRGLLTLLPPVEELIGK